MKQSQHDIALSEVIFDFKIFSQKESENYGNKSTNQTKVPFVLSFHYRVAFDRKTSPSKFTFVPV